MCDSNHDAVDPDANASIDSVEAVRALGFAWQWQSDFWPKWSDLHKLTGPCALEQINSKAVCDDTLEVLRFTPNVTLLDLMSSRVTDEGMSSMRYIPRLETLYLNNTRIGDEGIKHLLGHKNLKRVVAMNARVTIVGERLLKTSIPGCMATIGRAIRRGIVTALNRFSLTVELRHSHKIVTAVVAEDRSEELAEFLKAPVGKRVFIRIGEADEPNRLWRVDESDSS